MQIIVNNQPQDLTIIDPKTGIEWTRDLLGNADALNYDDETEQYTMDADQFEWWDSYIKAEQDLQDRYHALRGSLDDDQREQLEQQMIDAGDSDYESMQSAQIAVVEEWESRTK